VRTSWVLDFWLVMLISCWKTGRNYGERYLTKLQTINVFSIISSFRLIFLAAKSSRRMSHVCGTQWHYIAYLNSQQPKLCPQEDYLERERERPLPWWTGLYWAAVSFGKGRERERFDYYFLFKIIFLLLLLISKINFKK
jgi:hypothetical protein